MVVIVIKHLWRFIRENREDYRELKLKKHIKKGKREVLKKRDEERKLINRTVAKAKKRKKR